MSVPGKPYSRTIILGKGAHIYAGATKVIDGTTGAVTADIQATAGSIGATEIATGAVTRLQMSTSAGLKSVQVVTATIPTTGAVYIDVIAPLDGYLTAVKFNGVETLATHDTNYETFSIVNRGQAGSGTADMLDTGAVNTTKITGGSAITANTTRNLGLHGTPANLNVVQGDILRVTSTAAGTLANVVTIPKYMLTFGGTT